MARVSTLAFCACVLLGTVGVGFADDDSTNANDRSAVEFFENKIRPVLADHCFKCHGPDEQESGLRVDSRDALIRGGDIGPAIHLQEPDESLLVQAIEHSDVLQMPPDRKLDRQQIRDLTTWVKMGAPWPGDRPGDEESPGHEPRQQGYQINDNDRQFWSFQPISDPPVPQVHNAQWCRNDVDRFILAELQSHQLQPTSEADKYALLRRVTFDLTGLPPTPEEINAFASDDSENAYEQVVERLLNSPRYGEHWGRHWLDVVRFAESAGHDSDWAYRLAWRYRDYVIDSFHNDKPYDQFIVEQLAGDLLPRSGDADVDLQHRIATGFLHIGHRPLAERDKQQMALEIVDEQLGTTGIAFMGLTIGCARCHDHKFDPIPTKDYYSLASIFMSTKTIVDKISDSMFLEYEVAGADGKRALVMAARDETKPVDMKVHLRGSYKTLGESAPRGVLQVIAGKNTPTMPEGGSGRLQLAHWIASPDNPLTARVMVNRIWQQHFGTGLVASSGDFGRRGDLPSHPELLDWLSSRFIDSGWSVKAIHRKIVLSSVYRQADSNDKLASQIDPDNRLLGKMNRRRLSAEQVRDGLLAASEQLDLSTGGSMLVFRDGWGRPRQYPKEDGIYARAIYGFRVREKLYPPFEQPRRSVYLPQIRSIRPEFLQLFDGPDLGGPTSRRGESTVAPQSLFFMNGDFVDDAATALAQRLVDDRSGSRQDFRGSPDKPKLLTSSATDEPRRDSDMIQRAFLQVLGRPVTAWELQQSEQFVSSMRRSGSRQDFRETLDKPKPSTSSATYNELVQQTPGLLAYYRLDELHEFQHLSQPHAALNSADLSKGTNAAHGRYLHHMKWKKPGGGFFDGFSFNDVAFGRPGAIDQRTMTGRRNTSVGFNMPYEWPFDDQSDTGVPRGHHVRVDDVEAFNETQEISVEYWLHPIIAPWTGMVVGRDDGKNERVFRSGIQPATVNGKEQNVVYYEFFGDGNGGERSAAEMKFVAEPAKWTHVALTFGKGKRRLFVNGVCVDERDVTGKLPTSEVPLTIASRPDESDWFAGMVDEVAIYSRVLDQQEILRRFETATGRSESDTPTSPELVAWTAFCKSLFSSNEFLFVE